MYSHLFLLSCLYLPWTSLYGSHNFFLTTEETSLGSGIFELSGNDSWVGDGTVQHFGTTAGTSNSSFGDGGDLIRNFTSGVLTTSEVIYPANTSVEDLSATHSIVVTGGSADLSTRYAGNVISFSVEILSPTSSVSWTTTYNHALHGRRGTSGMYHPWGPGSRISGQGVGVTGDLQLNISGVHTISQEAGNGNISVAPGLTDSILSVDYLNGASFGLTASGSGSNTVINGQLTGLANLTHINNDYRGVNSITLNDPTNEYEPSPSGTYNDAQLSDGIISEGERVAATTFNYVWTPNGASDFSEGTILYFSMDGLLGLDSGTVIPEPSALALLPIGVLGLFLRRKRKAKN